MFLYRRYSKNYVVDLPFIYFQINTTIEKMDLEGNYILGVGATCLAKVLKDNVYVTELVSFLL